MKPSWSDAPKWARWMAMDEVEEWWWYKTKPKASFHMMLGGYWLNNEHSCFSGKTKDRRKWYNTLEARPKKEIK